MTNGFESFDNSFSFQLNIEFIANKNSVFAINICLIAEWALAYFFGDCGQQSQRIIIVDGGFEWRDFSRWVSLNEENY